MAINFNELTTFFREYKDIERSEKMKSYMKDQYEYIGLKAKERRTLAKSFKKEHTYFSLDDIELEAKKVWALEEREFQYIYLDFLVKNKKKLNKDSIEIIEYLITTKAWWDTVDLIASHLVGEVFKKYPDLIERYVKKWQDSNNMWLRRSLILFQLKYKEETDKELLFKIINMNLDSSEFFINKAIGWILREYSKTNKEAVAAFVKCTDLSKLSQREASKYL